MARGSDEARDVFLQGPGPCRGSEAAADAPATQAQRRAIRQVQGRARLMILIGQAVLWNSGVKEWKAVKESLVQS